MPKIRVEFKFKVPKYCHVWQKYECDHFSQSYEFGLGTKNECNLFGKLKKTITPTHPVERHPDCVKAEVKGE